MSSGLATQDPLPSNQSQTTRVGDLLQIDLANFGVLNPAYSSTVPSSPQFESLEKEMQKVKEAYSRELRKNERLEEVNRTLIRELELLRNENTMQENQKLRQDNTVLRNRIATYAQSTDGVIRAENHYIEQLHQIEYTISEWVVKQVRGNIKVEMERGYLPVSVTTLMDEIIPRVEGLGTHGRTSARALARSFQAYFGDRKSRITLIRHIISLYLFHEVLDKFTFGFEQLMSDFLQKLEDHICYQGNSSTEDR